MAYHDISTPAQVLNREIALTRSFFQAIGSFLSGLSMAMSANSTLQRRVDLVQELNSKSDAELAEMKIKREEIVQRVFGDLYYV